jgi:hypothetical protein
MSLTTVLQADSTVTPKPSVALGTRNYTVVAYCPALSVYFHTHSSLPYQLSGFVAFQTNDLNSTLGFDSFTIWDTSNNLNLATKTFNQLYGTSTSFNVGKFVWASNIDLSFVTPEANLVGTMYKGSFPINTLFSIGGDGVETESDLTVQQLINIADDAVGGAKSFNLTSAVVNNSLCSAVRQRFDLNAANAPYTFLGAEKVQYVVLQTPAQSITDNSNRLFTLMGRITGNFGFYPSATDSFLYNMFRVNPYHFGTSILDEVPYNSLKKSYTPPSNQEQLRKFINNLGLLASETSGWVSGGSSSGLYEESKTY